MALKFKKVFKVRLIDFLLFVIVGCLIAYLIGSYGDHVIYPTPQSFEVTGKPYFIDGDSIVIDKVEMRLLGMDAPELHQFCQKGDVKYSCGVSAKNHLVDIIGNDDITCRWSERDQYHRALAVCFKGDLFINRQMVLDGFAVNFYDFPYEEKIAKLGHKGIWQFKFQRPKDWRRNHRWKD